MQTLSFMLCKYPINQLFFIIFFIIIIFNIYKHYLGNNLIIEFSRSFPVCLFLFM